MWWLVNLFLNYQITLRSKKKSYKYLGRDKNTANGNVAFREIRLKGKKNIPKQLNIISQIFVLKIRGKIYQTFLSVCRAVKLHYFP